jgi:Reverse transcriptase (RNA-dependent DNA polymerase)
LDTFSPVAKSASQRTILAIVARFDWKIESFDLNGAYLNGELGEDGEIYMQEQPRYKEGEGQVKRLWKLLYGLKQAGRKWYDALTQTLADLSLRISQGDPGVFHAQIGEHILILTVHVNDCAIMGSLPELIAKYKRKLNARYSLTNLGPIHC